MARELHDIVDRSSSYCDRYPRYPIQTLEYQLHMIIVWNHSPLICEHQGLHSDSSRLEQRCYTRAGRFPSIAIGNEKHFRIRPVRCKPFCQLRKGVWSYNHFHFGIHVQTTDPSKTGLLGSSLPAEYPQMLAYSSGSSLISVNCRRYSATDLDSMITTEPISSITGLCGLV